MLRGKWTLWAATTATAMLLATGCCEQQNRQIESLRKDNDLAVSQLKDAREQLNASMGREQDARIKADSLAAELANRDAEVLGLRARLSDPNLVSTGRTPAGWERGLFGDKIVVGGDVLFDPGKAILKAGAQARLDKIVQDIKSHYPNMVIRIYGHTDSDPIRKTANLWDDNLELSANRAMTVSRYLKDKGIAPSFIETIGMGAYHPVSSDKARNRRVEIYVVKAK